MPNGRPARAGMVALAAILAAAILAMMSHELRTPLNAIIGFSEIIKDSRAGSRADARCREYAADIWDSGQHLLGLINDILDLSRIDAGSVELHEEDIDVAGLARSVLRMVEGQAVRAGVEIQADLPERLPRLRADARKVRQVLLNLVSNALKFTPAGGTVVVLAWARKSGEMVFQVADRGIGIAPEDIPLALSPFAQVESDLTRKYGGAGLGLPLAKTLVEQHGGSLDMHSMPGLGTTVTVAFPAARVDVWPAPGAARALAARPRPATAARAT